jgi:geranylgeranyl pyrophosphate synthase
MKTPEAAETAVRPDFPEALRRTREEMRRTLTNAPTAVKKLTGHLARAEGKLIRARALLTCAMAATEQSTRTRYRSLRPSSFCILPPLCMTTSLTAL